jgi:hypothetical protein
LKTQTTLTSTGVASSTNPNDYPDGHVVLFVDRASRVPRMDVVGKSDPYGMFYFVWSLCLGSFFFVLFCGLEHSAKLIHLFSFTTGSFSLWIVNLT